MASCRGAPPMEPPEKRLRPRLSTTDEERIACNAGRFEQADECGDDEREALPPGVDEKVWCTIRNSIVARWLQDVSRPMTADAACSAFVERYHPLARTVLAWLHAHGHVNYGLLAAAPWAVEPSKPSVLIIGAGLAGLAAARALLSFGHAVAVVEARDRPGGRVHTVRLGEGGGGVTGAAELGGAVLTGCDANPLAVLARQLDARLHAVRDRCPLFDDQGAPVPRERDACVERRFNGLLDACGAFRNDVGAAADSVSLGRALHMFAPEAGFGDDCPAEERGACPAGGWSAEA